MLERPLAPEPSDEEDAAIRAGIEADPEEKRSTELSRAGKLRPLTKDSLAHRMREAALRKARERAAQADTEDE